MKTATIHEQLKLPSSYRSWFSLSGYGVHTHFSLRVMRSSTGGHVPVYAAQTNFGAWEEITAAQLLSLANDVIQSELAYSNIRHNELATH